MKILDISAVRPGNRLARAIFSGEGKLLFPPGEVLSEKSLEELRQWGIASVAVDVSIPAPAVDETSVPPEDLMQAVREMVADRFSLLDMKDPHIAALFELAVERQGRIMLSKPGKIAMGGKPSPAFHTPRPPQAAIQPLIAASLKMGTLPIVFHRLVEIINSPYASPNDAAKVIATDPALSAKLLRLVNSPFYGLPTRIDTIPRAVVLVGTGQLVMLAMGATLVTAFKGVPVSLVNMQSFWSHSIGCGVGARLLAQRAGIADSESFFVAGLLHDIARLLVYTQLPTHALYLLTEAKRQQVSVHSLEKQTLGFTHEELGAELLRSWRCPQELVNRVLKHHAPLSRSRATAEDAALPAANMITQALGFGSSGEIYLPSPGEGAWALLGLSPEQLTGECQTMEDKIRELRLLLSAAG